jgi:hypothetical protein
VTHDEACAQLRQLGADLKYGRLSLAAWTDEVHRVIGEAYPDAKRTNLVPRDATSRGQRPLRKNTSQSSRYDALAHTQAQDLARADAWRVQ